MRILLTGALLVSGLSATSACGSLKPIKFEWKPAHSRLVELNTVWVSPDGVKEHHFGMMHETRGYRYTKEIHEGSVPSDLLAFPQRQYCTTWVLTWSPAGDIWEDYLSPGTEIDESCSDWIPQGKL